jgi:hypothetical protein
MVEKSNDDSDENDDVEDLGVETAPDDVTSLIPLNTNIVKTTVFLFVLFILLHSDVFVDRVLSSSDNSYVEGRSLTTKGTIIQGVLLSLGYVLIHALISSECV